MTHRSDAPGFTFGPLLALFLPSVAISTYCDPGDVLPASAFAVGAITALSVLLYVARNWEQLVAGILGSLFIIIVLTLCTLIPFVGWIAGILIFVYAFASILGSINVLFPYALKAAALWALFLISMMPALFHPVGSPAVMLFIALGMGSALAKKDSPGDEFILMLASIPLLALAIASLGRLLQSGFIVRPTQLQQNVSGYTTRSGVQVGDYTRTVTRPVVISTTSVNPGAAALGAAAGQGAREQTQE